MKRVFTFLLSAIMMAGSMLPGNDLHELVKVPVLVQHYFEHTSEQQQLSFFDFLALHYTGSEERSKQDEHKDLPFFHHCPVTVVYTCAENTDISFEVPVTEIDVVSYPHPLYFYQSHPNIFQPPRA